jgi:predicted DNA-binding transcriptional regulator AlpA
MSATLSALQDALGSVRITGRREFTSTEVAQMVRPCVYFFLRGEEILYIGQSCIGVMRAFDPHHHKRGRRSLKPDRILCIWFKSHAAAQNLEQELIAKLQPRGNAIGVNRNQIVTAVKSRPRRQTVVSTASRSMLTVEDVAARLQISKASVYELMRAREGIDIPRLPARKIGRSLQVAAANLEAWVLTLPKYANLVRKDAA